jgi:hypothetical protein
MPIDMNIPFIVRLRLVRRLSTNSNEVTMLTIDFETVIGDGINPFPSDCHKIRAKSTSIPINSITVCRLTILKGSKIDKTFFIRNELLLKLKDAPSLEMLICVL